jgi:hypothetical protein
MTYHVQYDERIPIVAHPEQNLATAGQELSPETIIKAAVKHRSAQVVEYPLGATHEVPDRSVPEPDAVFKPDASRIPQELDGVDLTPAAHKDVIRTYWGDVPMEIPPSDHEPGKPTSHQSQ